MLQRFLDWLAAMRRPAGVSPVVKFWLPLDTPVTSPGPHGFRSGVNAREAIDVVPIGRATPWVTTTAVTVRGSRRVLTTTEMKDGEWLGRYKPPFEESQWQAWLDADRYADPPALFPYPNGFPATSVPDAEWAKLCRHDAGGPACFGRGTHDVLAFLFRRDTRAPSFTLLQNEIPGFGGVARPERFARIDCTVPGRCVATVGTGYPRDPVEASPAWPFVGRQTRAVIEGAPSIDRSTYPGEHDLFGAALIHDDLGDGTHLVRAELYDVERATFHTPSVVLGSGTHNWFTPRQFCAGGGLFGLVWLQSTQAFPSVQANLRTMFEQWASVAEGKQIPAAWARLPTTQP